MPRRSPSHKGGKKTHAVLDRRYAQSDWIEAVDEIRQLPTNQFKSCWPAIVVEAIGDGAGLRGISAMLTAVRHRYGHVGPDR